MYIDLSCPSCKNSFDEHHKIPLQLPKCGHTVCQQCIGRSVPEVKCVECQRVYTGVSMDLLPKNMQVLNLLSKYSMQNSVLSSIKDDSKNQHETSSIMNSSVINDSNNCKKHHRIREICCIDCRELICSKCALFDSHKEHAIRELEEVTDEIADNVDKVMKQQEDIRALLDKVDRRPWEPVFIKKFCSALSDKKEKIISHITKLKNYLDEKLEQVSDLFELKEKLIVKKLKNLNVMTKSDRKNIEEWNRDAENILKVFEQSDDLCFDFTTDNCKEILNTAKLQINLIKDCEIPTEAVLKDIEEILQHKELKQTTDLNKLIKNDLIQIPLQYQRDLQDNKETIPSSKTEQNNKPTNSYNQRSSIELNQETGTKRSFGDMNLNDELLDYKSPEKTLSVIDLNSERLCQSLNLSTKPSNNLDSNNKLTMKRSEKSNKDKIDKRFIENTHQELNNIKESFASITSNTPVGNENLESNRPAMSIDLLSNEDLTETDDIIDFNLDDQKSIRFNDEEYKSISSVNDSTLDLSNNQFDLKVLKQRLKMNHTLLRINNAKLTDQDLARIVDLMQKTLNKVTNVEIKNNQITDKSYTVLKEYLQQNDDITQINISGNQSINQESFRSINKLVIK